MLAVLLTRQVFFFFLIPTSASGVRGTQTHWEDIPLPPSLDMLNDGDGSERQHLLPENKIAFKKGLLNCCLVFDYSVLSKVLYFLLLNGHFYGWHYFSPMTVSRNNRSKATNCRLGLKLWRKLSQIIDYGQFSLKECPLGVFVRYSRKF